MFKNKALLRNHITLTCANIEQKKRFKCDICDKAYPTTNKLKNHTVTHSGTRNFECSRCGKTFMTKKALTYHDKSIRPFKCDTCEKSFMNGNKLVHTGVLEFHCSICGGKFNQKINKNTREKKCKVV